MKNIIALSVFLMNLVAADTCKAQWQQFQLAIGGNSVDLGSTIIQTADHGYAIAGYTQSFGSGFRDMYILKLDANGLLEWTKTFGGTNNDEAFSIVQTADGSYTVAGYTSSFGVAHDKIYILRLDSNGSLVWNEIIGGTNFDYAKCIVQTTDGGYAIAGITSSFGAAENDLYILKLSNIGAPEWSKTIGGSFFDYAHSIVQASDGGFAIAGYTGSFGAGGWDMYIVKFDAGGAFQWNRTIGGPYDDFAYSIKQTADGGYVIAGYTLSFNIGFRSFYIVKFDAFGTLQWTRSVRGSYFSEAWSIFQTLDGGYAVAGRNSSTGPAGYDLFVVKLDPNGSLQWSRTAGGIYDGVAYSIIQTADGGYVATGYTNYPTGNESNLFVVKFDVSGNTCGNSSSPICTTGTGGTVYSPTPSITSVSPSVYSYTPSFATGGIVTTICNVAVNSFSNEIPETFTLYQNYPNPFNPTTRIRFSIPLSRGVDAEGGWSVLLKVYDILGREVASLVNEQLKPGTYEVDWDATEYPSGVYFYKLITESFSKTKRMVLVK